MQILEINGTGNSHVDQPCITVSGLTTITLTNGRNTFTITFSGGDSIEVQVGFDPACEVLAESAIVRMPYSDVVKITPESRE